MPAVGLMVFMVWLAMQSAVTEASGFTPIRSVRGAITGMVSGQARRGRHQNAGAAPAQSVHQRSEHSGGHASQHVGQGIQDGVDDHAAFGHHWDAAGNTDDDSH